MNRTYLRLLLFLSLLFLVLFTSCGVDFYFRDRGHVEIVHLRPYDTYELRSTGYDVGCSSGFTDFLDENYGYTLKPEYNYITLSYIDHNSIEIWIEDININVVAHYNHYSGFYYGIWDNVDFIYDCEIGEVMEIWVEDTGYEIYVDVINQFDNSTFGRDCPLNNIYCENIISFVGYPI